MTADRQERLLALGWNAFCEGQKDAGDPESGAYARIVEDQRGEYVLSDGARDWRAKISGKLRYALRGGLEWPAVGDWVLMVPRPEDGQATIIRLLARKSVLERAAVNEHGERVTTDGSRQVLAANVDTALILCSLNQNFNVRRIERFLALVRACRIKPVVALTKGDLAEDADAARHLVAAAAPGVNVYVLSALEGWGHEPLASLFAPGQTVVLLGSSGVGKSTLINRLLGEHRQKVSDIRNDDGRGRHTTTTRQLIRLPGGGMIIDTPGLRELQLVGEGESLGEIFKDIQALMAQCRFRDCRHEQEPGCAVKAALTEGTLEEDRYRSFLKLQREITFQATKHDKAARSQAEGRWKRVIMDFRQRRALEEKWK